MEYKQEVLLKSVKRVMASPVPLPALAKPEASSLGRLEQRTHEVGGLAELAEKCLLPGLRIENASN